MKEAEVASAHEIQYVGEMYTVRRSAADGGRELFRNWCNPETCFLRGGLWKRPCPRLAKEARRGAPRVPIPLRDGRASSTSKYFAREARTGVLRITPSGRGEGASRRRPGGASFPEGDPINNFS